MRCSAAVVSLLAFALFGCVVDLGPKRTRAFDPSADGSDGESSGATHDPLGWPWPDDGEAGPRCELGGRALWAARFGDGNDQTARAVASDGEGGVYVTGDFAGELDLGAGPMTSVGDRDIFLARFDGDGQVLWNQRFGDGANQSVYLDLAPTPDGVILAGEIVGTVDFGGGPVTADEDDAFATRFTAAGAHVWTRKLGGPGRQEVHGLAFDATSDTVLVAGTFAETMDVGGTPLTSAGSRDGFVVRLDAEGVPTWHASFGGPDIEGLTSVVVDGQGRFTIGGGGNSDFDVGLGPVELEADGAAFMVSYAADHTPLWAESYTGPALTQTRHLALASSGLLVAAGAIWGGSTEFCGNPVSSNQGGFFSVLLASSADCTAQKALPNLEDMTSIHVDPNIDILVTGSFDETTDFGSAELTSAGGEDGLVAKLGPGLSPHWVFHFGASLDDSVAGLGLAPDGSAIILGDFREQILIEGCPPLESAGGSDLLLAKLAP
jgi:hypothetical protein